MNETGSVVTSLALCLLIAWITVYFSMIRGIKSSGKVICTVELAHKPTKLAVGLVKVNAYGHRECLTLCFPSWHDNLNKSHKFHKDNAF